MSDALTRRTFVATLGAALAVEVIIFGGCATRPSPQVKLDKPISETMTVAIRALRSTS